MKVGKQVVEQGTERFGVVVAVHGQFRTVHFSDGSAAYCKQVGAGLVRVVNVVPYNKPKSVRPAALATQRPDTVFTDCPGRRDLRYCFMNILPHRAQLPGTR